MIGDPFSGVLKKCCAQGRCTAKLMHPVGKTDMLAIFWSSLYMAAYFWTPGNIEICSFFDHSHTMFVFSKIFRNFSKFPHFYLAAAEMKYAYG